jgi:arginine-tRNA-protein transferase
MDLPPMVFDQFESAHLPPEEMDRLWAQGWRHFGTDFFRYSISFDEDGLKVIEPLRIDLARFVPGKSQRRVIRKNDDTRWEIVPAQLHSDVCEMFQRHKSRFHSNIPEHLENFLGPSPGLVTPCQEFRVYLGDRLVAASFLDVGKAAVSSVYGIFEPEFTPRSLGIFTMLLELEWAKQNGIAYYYPGYATREPSHYDYKKRFSGLQSFDWDHRRWRDIRRV